MFQQPVSMLVPFAVTLLVHLAGLIVAIILLGKAKSTPAILSTVAFGLLLIQDVGTIMRVTFLDQYIVRQMPFSFRTISWAMGGLGCCCSLFNLVAFVCLIIALWQALSGQTVEEAETPTLEEEPATEEPA
jgi:hypothetical protein